MIYASTTLKHVKRRVFEDAECKPCLPRCATGGDNTPIERRSETIDQ